MDNGSSLTKLAIDSGDQLMTYIKKLFLTLFSIHLLLISGCGSDEKSSETASDAVAADPKITFVELGSVRCVPCKMMQPVMSAIEKEFGDQIEVVFHDVWKDAEPGKKYGIRVIPTQVFLDEAGEEFFRHEGYLPKEEIEKLLIGKGLEILKKVDVKK